jgi:hypothetical protein
MEQNERKSAQERTELMTKLKAARKAEARLVKCEYRCTELEAIVKKERVHSLVVPPQPPFLTVSCSETLQKLVEDLQKSLAEKTSELEETARTLERERKNRELEKSATSESQRVSAERIRVLEETQRMLVSSDSARSHHRSVNAVLGRPRKRFLFATGS